MKLKQTMLTTLTAFMLVSCAGQDNAGKTQQVDDARKIAVTQLWDGYEELQGKQFGKVFTMPSVITAKEAKEFYTFELRNPEISYDAKTKGREIFKKYFGDEFDEARCEYDETNEIMHYKQSPDDGNVGSCHSGAFSMAKESAVMNASTDTIIAELDPEKDRETAIELNGEDVRVSELCASAERILADICGDYIGIGDGFIIKPDRLVYYTSAQTGKEYAEIFAGYHLGSAGILNDSTYYNETDRDGVTEIHTNYQTVFILLVFDSKDNAVEISPSSRPVIPENKQKCESLIPLGEAVSIMENELAENSGYVFDGIDLIYCAKTRTRITQYSDDSWTQEWEEGIYEPTWSFYFTEQGMNSKVRNSVKVNAVTGEITMDIGR